MFKRTTAGPARVHHWNLIANKLAWDTACIADIAEFQAQLTTAL